MKIICRKRRNLGFTMVELLPPIGLAGLMGVGASMLLPALAKAKAKANRIKCVHNLGHISKAHNGFAQDNGERLPWQLTPSGVRFHLDAEAQASDGYGIPLIPGKDNELKHHPKVSTVGGVFGMRAMKSGLQSTNILHSPCDPERAAGNEIIQVNWRSYDTKAGKPVPHAGLSYGLCLGADTQRPATVLAVTRNLDKDDLLGATWVGAIAGKKRSMAGLDRNQGQMTFVDGSAMQSYNADLKENGRIKDHLNSRGGMAKEKSSTKVMLPY